MFSLSCTGAPASISITAGSGKSNPETGTIETKPQESSSSAIHQPQVQEALYPAQNQILAAVPLDSESFSYARFYLATILTPASPQTKNQYEVQLLASTSNYGKGGVLWTDKVIRKTHQVTKQEIKTGMVVLYPANKDIWSRAVVGDTSDLFKDEVELLLFWGAKPDPYDRKEKWKIQRLRVSDDPVFQAPR